MSKIVFITGASSGFGKACAEKFACHGYDVIINGRREDRLLELKDHLEKKYNTAILVSVFDVRNRNEVFEAVKNIPGEWQHIDILINNAGLALGRDYFDEADIDDWDTMIDTNVKGLIYSTKALLPFLKKSSSPHIINLVLWQETFMKKEMFIALPKQQLIFFHNRCGRSFETWNQGYCYTPRRCRNRILTCSV